MNFSPSDLTPFLHDLSSFQPTTNELFLIQEIARHTRYSQESLFFPPRKILFQYALLSPKDTPQTLQNILHIFSHTFNPSTLLLINSIDLPLLKEFIHAYYSPYSKYSLSGNPNSDLPSFIHSFSHLFPSFSSFVHAFHPTQEFYQFLTDSNFHSFSSYTLLQQFDIIQDFLLS